MRSDMVPGAVFPDYELAEHTGKHRKLSELQGQHPMVLVLSRGGFCPKDRRQAEGLVALHRELEVGYCRLVIGGLATAGLMGGIGYWFSNQAIFFTSAALALPTLVALRAIRADDIHFGRACGAPPGDYHPWQPPRTPRIGVCTKRHLLIFASCIVLFQLANASALPLVSEGLGRDRASSLVLSALIVIPQVLVAALAPWVGRSAKAWGRRPLLLIGLAALPIRAAFFAFIHNPLLLAAVQVLDGISGAVIGVLTPVIIADITNGTGRFNLAQGVVGTLSGAGAAVSTVVSGYVAQTFGGDAGFYFIIGVASTAVAVCWAFMPETKSASSMPPPHTRADGGQSPTVHAVS